MRVFVRAARAAVLLAIVLAAAGCGDPPTKEMNQAQGAIDAARAAGAEQYASDEYKAAVDALRRAQDAVGQRDYRQALNDALDSRERAQNAAREASSQKALARSQAERLLAEVTTAVAAATGRLDAAHAAKVPAKSLQGRPGRCHGHSARLARSGDGARAGGLSDGSAGARRPRGQGSRGHRADRPDSVVARGQDTPQTVTEFGVRNSECGAEPSELGLPDVRNLMADSESGDVELPSPPRDAFGADRGHERDGHQRSASHVPSQTTSAHPVRKTPSSVQSTCCAPPGAMTSTDRSAPPCAIAAIADAHAPVPDDSVGPTPRSQIRIRTRLR